MGYDEADEVDKSNENIEGYSVYEGKRGCKAYFQIFRIDFNDYDLHSLSGVFMVYYSKVRLGMNSSNRNHQTWVRFLWIWYIKIIHI